MTIPRVPTARHGNCSYPDLKRRLSMFRALIFDSNVDAGTPSRPAAPKGPATRPLLALSAASMAFLFVGRQRAGGRAGERRGPR